MTDPVTLLAPAKLNLWLRLTGVKRPDGRHELESHFAPLELADVLTVTEAKSFGLSTSGTFAEGVPTDSSNLVWQAFEGFCQTFAACPNLHIHMEKHIPHGAGLGGGSSDAGALLKYLATQTRIPLKEVQEWSLCLGADLPAAIGPHSGHVSGVGEILGDVLPLPSKHVLLVKPKASCPTGHVFKNWSQQDSAIQLGKNDLEIAAAKVCPDIAKILTYLRAELDPEAQMTGSGSACFALLSSADAFDARHQQALADHWTCLTQFRAPDGNSGPTGVFLDI